MSKNRFSLPLALVDTIPVILFLISCVLFGRGIHSWIFIVGAALCTLAGIGKVLWKILLAVNGKDHLFLNKAFFPCMLSGFALLIIGIIWAVYTKTFPSGYLMHLLRTNVLISLLISVIFMIAMVVVTLIFRRKFDTSERLNWIGEILNIGFQAGILSAVINIQ